MNIRPGFSQGRDYCENYGGLVPQGRRKMSSFFFSVWTQSWCQSWLVLQHRLSIWHSYCTCCSGRPSAMLHPKYLRVKTVPGGSISIQYLESNHLCPGFTVSWCNPSAFSTPFPEGKHKLLWELLISSLFFVEEADGKTPDGHWDDWKSNSPGLWMPGTVSATKATWVLRGISCWKECLHSMRKSYS